MKAIDPYEELGIYHGTLALSRREIAYRETKPKQIKVRIPLVEFFERVKRLKADRWQQDFCRRLQEAAVNRWQKATLQLTHAEAQLGKSVILAQIYIAWLLGHDHEHRIILATYNISKSSDHSDAIIQILKSDVYREVFSEPDAQLPPGPTAKEKWSTVGRQKVGDAQYSFRAVGLSSGITGSGADTFIIDDPYATVKDALSPVINRGLQKFWDYDIKSRKGEYSNVFAMFHRYQAQDLAGYLLDSGEFDYWRYAAICDGDYIHKTTGRVYPDPLDRNEGDLISPERRSERHYEQARKNPKLWASMFQGRPEADSGNFFNVTKINLANPEDAAELKPQCVVLVRSWDNAATDELDNPDADWTFGTLSGIRADGSWIAFNVVFGQLDSAARLQLQTTTAAKDGPEVIIRIPQDPGSAGKFEAWATKQILSNYTVIAKPVSGSKISRALNLSAAVNEGKVTFVRDTDLPDDLRWHSKVFESFSQFPLTSFDDPVDSAADGYNECFEILCKGMIVKHFAPQRNLISVESFQDKFPVISREGMAEFRIPAAFTLYAGVKLSADASRPSSAILVARAPVNSGLRETLFVFGEYKSSDGDFYRLFKWIDETLRTRCEKRDCLIFAHQSSQSALETIYQKLPFTVQMFDGDESAGLAELGWYLMERERPHPFLVGQNSTNLFFVINRDQFIAADRPREPEESFGFYHARQELRTWGYDENGKPTQVGQVMDCLRMVAAAFKTTSEPLTPQERFEEIIGPENLPKPDEEGQYRISIEEQQRLALQKQIAEEKLRDEFGDLEPGDGADDVSEEYCELCNQQFIPGQSFERTDTGYVHALCKAEQGDVPQKEWW